MKLRGDEASINGMAYEMKSKEENKNLTLSNDVKDTFEMFAHAIELYKQLESDDYDEGNLFETIYEKFTLGPDDIDGPFKDNFKKLKKEYG